MFDNVYFFRHDWESDFLMVRRGSEYVLEFEIKKSKGDLKNDFKKVLKHHLLKHRTYPEDYEGKDNPIIVPNQFYYVVPKGMDTEGLIPEYAGLIEIGDRFKTVKKAPFLHKDKVSVEPVLFSRLYYKLLAAEQQIFTLKNRPKPPEKIKEDFLKLQEYRKSLSELRSRKKITKELIGDLWDKYDIDGLIEIAQITGEKCK